MDRNDKLREISAHIRASHIAALFAVGYLASDAPDEVLNDLSVALAEVREEWRPEGHYEAYKERWGRVPDRPGA